MTLASLVPLGWNLELLVSTGFASRGRFNPEVVEDVPSWQVALTANPIGGSLGPRSSRRLKRPKGGLCSDMLRWKGFTKIKVRAVVQVTESVDQKEQNINFMKVVIYCSNL